MPSKPVDGLTVEAVHEAMEEAVNRARRGDGHTFRNENLSLQRS